MKEIWVCDSGHYTTQKPETDRCKCEVYDGAAICNGKIIGSYFPEYIKEELIESLESIKLKSNSVVMDDIVGQVFSINNMAIESLKRLNRIK